MKAKNIGKKFGVVLVVIFITFSSIGALAFVSTQPISEKQSGVVKAQSGAWPIAFDSALSANPSVIDISPNENYVAIGDGNGNVVIKEIPSGNTVTTLKQGTFQYSPIDVEWSPDGSELVFSGGSEIYLIDTSDWTLQDTYTFSYDAYSLDYKPDGSQLAVSHKIDAIGSIMDVTDTSLSQNTTFSTSSRYMGVVEYSPNGEFLAHGATDEVAILETDSYSRVQTLTHTDLQGSFPVAWNNDGTQLAVASGDSNNIGNTVIYDTSDYSVIESIPQNDYVPDRGVDYSPNGSKLLVGQAGSSSAINVYNTNDWSLDRSFTQSFESVDWSINYVAIQSWDGFYDVYDSEESTISTPTPIPTPTESQIETNLHIQAPSWLNYSQSKEIVVRYENGTKSETVTNNATITIEQTHINGTLLTYNSTSNEIVATSNTNLTGEVTLNARYQDLHVTKNVTVAPISPDNIEILPPLMKGFAVLNKPDNPIGGNGSYTSSDFRFIALIIIGCSAIAYGINCYAGILANLILLITGWIAGYVALGIVLVALFGTIFILLNTDLRMYGNPV